MEYISIEEFKRQCNIFTIEEKEDIIKEAILLNVNVMDYINFEVESYIDLKNKFKNELISKI